MPRLRSQRSEWQKKFASHQRQTRRELEGAGWNGGVRAIFEPLFWAVIFFRHIYHIISQL